MRRDDGRFDWDVPLGRRWALLLAVAFLLPIVVPAFGSAVWIWPWSAWAGAPTVDVLLGLVPVALGVVAWVLLGVRRRRLRGALLLVACAATLLLPYGRVFQGLLGNGRAWDLFLRIGWQGLALTLGVAMVIAGNRQQKRSLGRGAAPWIAAVGGAALLAVFFVPVGGLVVASVFLEEEAWEELWPALVWLLALGGLALAGLLSPLAARIGDPLETAVETAISRLARLLPLALPVVVVGLWISHDAPGVAYVGLFLAKILLHGYAVVALMSIGLARLLDDADPDYAEHLLEHSNASPEVGDAEPAATPA